MSKAKKKNLISRQILEVNIKIHHEISSALRDGKSEGVQKQKAEADEDLMRESCKTCCALINEQHGRCHLKAQRNTRTDPMETKAEKWSVSWCNR